MTIHEWIMKRPETSRVDQAIFIRDSIGAIFYPGIDPVDRPIAVVGEHRSLSHTLPVCEARFTDNCGVNVWIKFRGNFDTWAVSVDADTGVDVGGWDLFDEKADGILCAEFMERFSASEIFGPYANNWRRFSCHVGGSDETFWMFCRLLKGRRNGAGVLS